MGQELQGSPQGLEVKSSPSNNPSAQSGNLTRLSGASDRYRAGTSVDPPFEDWHPYVPEQVPRDDPRRFGVPVNVPVYVEPMHFMLSVQAFSGGGYEATVKMVDAQKIAERRCLAPLPRPRVARSEEERDPDNVLRSRYRAKKRVRHLVKEMGADRILTLTTREQSNTPESMLARWQHWLRLVEQAQGGRKFHYVAVLEPHPSNPAHLHLHVAVAVFLNVNILRQCWWRACGGRAMGNVHIKRLRSEGGLRRVFKVASYISKYLTKESTVEFNRKRYWASRIRLAEVRRYWLRGRTLLDAMLEAFRKIDYVVMDIRDLWINNRDQLVWFQAVPGCSNADPF